MFHQGVFIGSDYASLNNSYLSVRIDTRTKSIQDDCEVQRILSKHKSAFADLDNKPITAVPMRFTTLHNRPIFAKVRHYTPEEIKAMKDHIDDLLKKRIIEPTNSGYAATSRMIRKKNGTGRLVVNYIPLNAVTLRDSYSLPHISDIFGVIQGMNYFVRADFIKY